MSESDGSSSYKATLNLPDTAFPMRGDLVTREPDRLARWEKDGLYHRIVERRRAVQRVPKAERLFRDAGACYS